MSASESSDFSRAIAKNTADLPTIIGHRLERVIVFYLSAEFNSLWLQTDCLWFTAHPQEGGDIMGFYRAPEGPPPAEDYVWPNGCRDVRMYDDFIGHRVASTRQMGGGNNGHGFELSFEGVLDRTILIQSIDVAPRPERFWDCMRFGIGRYVYSSDDL